MGELGKQITDIAVTDAKINATKKVNAENKTPTLEERETAKKELARQGKKNDPSAVDSYIKEQAIQAEINSSGWQVGGDKRRIVESGTALIQGLVNGDVSTAVANASAPYIANQIAQHIDENDKAGRIAAHGIANVALALAKGENAAAQSLGAMTAEAVGMLSMELYKKNVSQLTEDEKATVSAFASLAAGIAGGLVGGDTSSAANAGQAGKTTVENNYLTTKNITNFIDSQAHAKTPEEKKQLQQDIDNLDKKLQSQAEGWGISTNDMKSALDSLKTLEGLPDCNAQCQEMVKDSISKLEPALENRIAKHSSQSENIKELTYILATVVVLNENGLIGNGSKETKPQISGNSGSQTKPTGKPDSGSLPNKDIAGSDSQSKLPSNGKGSVTSGAENSAVINPATNKAVTDHTVVSSGKAPKTSTPNSVYEVSRADGTKSITYYDDKGKTFSREDYGQQKTHGQLGYDSNGKVPPHEHKISYNERGYVDKQYYREIDKNGKPVGPWIEDKK